MKAYLQVRRLAYPALLILVAYFSAFQTLDRQADLLLERSLQRSLAAFATARALNGVISVAQGTELAFHPTGLGVSLAPGEILDPVNDLLESLSWVLFASTSALAFQKLMLAFFTWPLFTYAVSGFLIFCVYLCIRSNHREAPFSPLVLRFLLFTLLLRFAIPGVTIATESLFETFLRKPHAEAMAHMSITKEELSKIDQGDNTKATSKGLLGGVLRFVENAIDTVDITARLERYQNAANELSRASINVAVIFLFQSIVIPLFFLVLCRHALSLLFRP